MSQEVHSMMEELEGIAVPKLWDPELVRRILKRLSAFSDCAQCQELRQRLEENITGMWKRRADLQQEDWVQHKLVVQEISQHLQSAHNLVENTYFTGLYMSVGLSLGLSLGITFGLTLMDNLALGMSMGMGIGMCLGLVIGATIDEDIKKKDKII